MSLDLADVTDDDRAERRRDRAALLDLQAGHRQFIGQRRPSIDGSA